MVLAGKYMGYTIDTAVKLLSIAGVTNYVLSAAHKKEIAKNVHSGKFDNLSNIVFLEVFIVALNVCTNFITERYRTITNTPHT